MHLGLFLSSSLVSHTHLSLPPLFHKSREPGVVVPTCLWQQQAEVAALPASGPTPSGERNSTPPTPGCTCGSCFSRLSTKCIHSACLGPRPGDHRVQTVSSEKEWGASQFSLRFASTLVPGVFPSPRGEPGQGLFARRSRERATEQAEVALGRTFHALPAAYPHCLLPPEGHCGPIPATQDPLPAPGYSWSPSGLCLVPP